MNRYYVIKSTDKETKDVIYFKMRQGFEFISTTNLADAKLFSVFAEAKRRLDCIQDDNFQTVYSDEIIVVEVDCYGNIFEIEADKEEEKMEKAKAVNLNSVSVLSGTPLDQEQVNTAKEVMNLFAESGYSIKEAMEILEFCKDSLQYSPVGIYEFEKGGIK